MPLVVCSTCLIQCNIVCHRLFVPIELFDNVILLVFSAYDALFTVMKIRSCVGECQPIAHNNIL